MHYDVTKPLILTATQEILNRSPSKEMDATICSENPLFAKGMGLRDMKASISFPGINKSKS
jgi:hypothetical protein